MHYETIKYGYSNKSNFKLIIQPLLEKYWPSFRFDVKRINKLLDSIIDSAYVYFEMPYVDKVFRDTYYTFFASKYKRIPRDCIRVFVFDGEFTSEDFDNKNNELQTKFLGYFIIRPVEQKTLGRSFFSPLAFKNKDLLCMLANEKSLLRGTMLSCSGFPHIAQDSEIMTCAESSIWMLVEYYSNRYKNYIPAMPSQITEVLLKDSYKRLLPSEGLTIFQISLAVKTFGFSTKVYFRDNYKQYPEKFNHLLYYYVESGIPLILGLQNDRKEGHAIILCGHEKFNDLCKDAIHNKKNIYYKNTGDSMKKIIVMDDNSIPYLPVDIDQPCAHYDKAELQNLAITYFIVPLYEKIYIDAEKAEIIFMDILSDREIGLETNSKENPYVIRIFLTSSKSFKKRISEYETIHTEMKEKLLFTACPKFIWVCEVTYENLYSLGLANGLIIIDATGYGDKSSIIFSYQNKRLLDKNKETLEYILTEKEWFDFSQYRNNLKGEWNHYSDY